MIIENMKILTSRELKKSLEIDEDDLGSLEKQGMPFVNLPGRNKIYLVSSIINFFSRIEQTNRPSFPDTGEGKSA